MVMNGDLRPERRDGVCIKIIDAFDDSLQEGHAFVNLKWVMSFKLLHVIHFLKFIITFDIFFNRLVNLTKHKYIFPVIN
jgi:hypothetical protein